MKRQSSNLKSYHVLKEKENSLIDKDWYIVATVCEKLGRLYQNLDDYESANRFYCEAITIYEYYLPQDYSYICAPIYNELGFICNQLMDFRKSKMYLEKAYTIYKESVERKQSDFIYTCIYLGDIFCKMDDYQSAIHYYEEASDLLEDCDDFLVDLASVCTKLGFSYSFLDQLQIGEGFHKKAYELYNQLAKLDMKKYLPYCVEECENLELIYDKKEDLISNIGCQKKKYRIFVRLIKANETQYKMDLLETCNKLGILYSSLYKYSEAEQYFMEAFNLCVELVQLEQEENKVYLASICNEIGVFFGNQKKYHIAENYFLLAYDIYKESADMDKNSVLDFLMVCKNLQSLYKRLLKEEDENKYLEEANRLSEKWNLQKS